MYLPTVMADLWGGGAIFLINFVYYAVKWCTLVCLMAVNPEKYALALMEALFTGEGIASSCYCVMKRSKKTPLPMEGAALYITHFGEMVVFIPESEHKGELS